MVHMVTFKQLYMDTITERRAYLALKESMYGHTEINT